MSDQAEKTSSPEFNAVVESTNHVAIQLHRLLSGEKGNIFFSPFSISTAMTMVYCAAKDDTEVEMKTSLGYDISGMSKDNVISSFQGYLTKFTNATESYALSCANSMVTQKNFEVKDEFKAILKESFNALLSEVDFQSDSEQVVNQINDWVKEKTNGKISNLIQSLDPETVIVLLNAVYFKGKWLHQFDKESTFKKDFYNYGEEEQAKTVDMMYIKESFLYMERDTFQALQLSYEGGDIAMLILLPKNKTNLETLEKELSLAFVENAVQEMHKRKVTVNLPRFRLQYSKSLVPCFQQLGVKKLFQTGAQLGGASDSPNLEVSSIIHEAVLEVNEEGCEAAAVTKMVLTKRKASPEINFIVDHPFIFAIYDEKNNVILFMGKVVEL